MEGLLDPDGVEEPRHGGEEPRDARGEHDCSVRDLTFTLANHRPSSPEPSGAPGEAAGWGRTM